MTIVFKHLNIPYTFLRHYTSNNIIDLLDRYDIRDDAMVLTAQNIFDCTITFDEEVLYFYVTRPPQIDRWRYILLVFSPSTWILTYMLKGITYEKRVESFKILFFSTSVMQKQDIEWELEVLSLEPLESLKLHHFVASFMILAVELTLSFFAFLMEDRHEKYPPRRNLRA
ncbi:hypothetical protein WA026_018512 [Henosepilachna vigintioctopunctata]|uniref:Uncharacterized protein n=1 Tax=Henosepilachna vigintioctopunctata TaxID=420089 RepID=A0AAW1V250_9CUCU